MSQINRLSTLGLNHRKRESGSAGTDTVDQSKNSAEAPSFYLQDLLHGGLPLPHVHYEDLRRRKEDKSHQPDPEIMEYLNTLRKKQARRELEGILGNGAHGKQGPQDGLGAALKDMHVQLGMGINVILLMITGFIVCWWIGKQAFGSEDDRSGFGGVGAILSGLTGMVAVMVVEMGLFVIREQRRIDREEAKESEIFARAKEHARAYREQKTKTEENPFQRRSSRQRDLGAASVSAAPQTQSPDLEGDDFETLVFGKKRTTTKEKTL